MEALDDSFLALNILLLNHHSCYLQCLHAQTTVMVNSTKLIMMAMMYASLPLQLNTSMVQRQGIWSVAIKMSLQNWTLVGVTWRAIFATIQFAHNLC